LLLASVTLVSYFASYSFIFWFPTMLKRQSGFSDVNVGSLGVVPYFVLFFAIQVNRWHSAVPLFVAADGFLGLVAQARSIPLSLLFFTMACLSSAFLSTFWAIPTEILSQSDCARPCPLNKKICKLQVILGRAKRLRG
jgi:hypothetical protein